MSRCLLIGLLRLLMFNLWAQGALASMQLSEEEDTAARPALVFIENKGQIRDSEGNARPDILFMVKSQEVTVFVHRQGLYYQFRKVDEQDGRVLAERLHPGLGSTSQEGPVTAAPRTHTVYQLGMKLLNTPGSAHAVGLKRTPYYENYFTGSNEGGGGLHAESFEEVLIKEVYPSIDWVLSVAGGRLKYDFIIRPGGRISDIQMQYSGAKEILVQEDGSLHISTPLGELAEEAPFTYQLHGAQKAEVESSYRLLDEETVGFRVGDYNDHIPLTIDPSVVWASYYGGSGLEYGTTTAIDASGNVYMGGWTESTDAIAVSGYQNTIAGNYDAFLVKFDAAGNRQWATYFGGLADDKANQIQLDSQGTIYMAGETKSEEGMASGGHQPEYGGGGDGFLARFDARGHRLWASYYGGEGFDGGHGLAIDAQDNIYLTGITASSTGIAADGHQNSFGGQFDAFLAKFNSAGQRQWATYYGGSGQDNTEDGHKGSVAVDRNGNIYITGWTSSPEAIAAGGYQQSFAGSGDAFLVKFSPAGNRLWATYYGGEGFDSGRGIAIDSRNQVYLAGITRSAGGIAGGGFQNTPGGHYDAFLAKFSEDGERQWATYYGGSGQDESKEGALCVDARDNVYLAGFTNSTDNIASCGFQDGFAGHYDAFVVKFSPEGRRRWGSYFGGDGFEITFDTRLDQQGYLYLVGWTTSRQGIATGGHQLVYGGGGDGFLVKIDPKADELEEPEIHVEGSIPLCPGGQVELSTALVEGVLYEWLRDEEVVSTAGNILSVQQAGSYTVRLLNACDTVMSEALEVLSFEQANAPTITASGPLQLCEGESVRLSVPETGEFSYQWLKDGEPVGDPSSQLIVAESGLYSLVCTYECGSLTTNALQVNVGVQPEPPVTFGDTLCGAGSLTLRAEGNSTAEYRWYESAEATTPIAGASGPEFITPYLEASATYYVSVLEGSCESRKAAVEAIISEAPVAWAGEDASISPGGELQLQASGGSSYSWSPAEGLSNRHIANPVAKPDKTTTYSVTVLNEEGCSAVDELTITVVSDVFIPNAFSPNSDGINDAWEIFNIELFPECKVAVYDRWGNSLFESKGYQAPWDGRFRGEILPAGSYAYVIQLSGAHQPVRGTLMIMY